MRREGSPVPAGWRLGAVLILLTPLVQGGTPRLPKSLVEIAVFALGAAWAWRWSGAPRQELRLTLFDGLAGLTVFLGLFSTLFAPYYHAAEQSFLPLLCFALLYGYLAFNPSFAGLGEALAAVRIQAAFQGLLVFWQRWGEGQLRPAGTFFNPNFLAGFLAVAVALALGGLLFPRESSRRTGWSTALGIGEAALGCGALLATGSRGGVLALAAGLLVLFGLRSWRLALVAGIAGTAALAAVPNPWMERLQSLPQVDAFAWTRVAIWRSAWSMMLDHPWSGIGLGQFEHVSPRYAFPVASHWAKHTRVAENAHSEYLQAGAELGAAGLLLAVAAPLLVALAARGRLRALPRRSWGEIVPLLAGLASIAAHAAVDFPLETPPGALLCVLLAAGLRVQGVGGPGRVVEFRFRRAYAGAALLAAIALSAAAARPVAGFVFFLKGIGAPVSLLREKWALEEAPRREVPLPDAVRLLGLAARIDFPSAPYHRALGSRLFQAYLRGESGDAGLTQALYHLNFASELNPNNFQYFVNLGQAMTSLARRNPPGRGYLEEALGHYRHAAELAPFQYPLHVELGALSEELGDLPGAEAHFRRAVDIEEYYLRGWYNLGVFYARAGRADEALATFRHGADLASRARTLTPTSAAERELIALEPAVFYNELRKLEHRTEPGAPS